MKLEINGELLYYSIMNQDITGNNSKFDIEYVKIIEIRHKLEAYYIIDIPEGSNILQIANSGDEITKDLASEILLEHLYMQHPDTYDILDINSKIFSIRIGTLIPYNNNKNVKLYLLLSHK